MRRSTRFFTTVRNNVVGLVVLAGIWFILALFFPSYILPSPGAVLRAAPSFLNNALLQHLGITLYRAAVGFCLAFGAGSALGTLCVAFTLAEGHAEERRLTEHLNSFMAALQVIPGPFLGVILLLVPGIGSWVPIALVALLTLPTIAINTANALKERSVALEHYLLSAGATRRHLIKHLYVPTLIPTFQSNLSLGFGLSLKVVILGEFIGAQEGIGYLLNVAAIHFDMKTVLFYLGVVLVLSALFEIAQSFGFAVFLTKYFYPE